MANKTLKITFVYWYFIKSNTTINRVKKKNRSNNTAVP